MKANNPMSKKVKLFLFLEACALYLLMAPLFHKGSVMPTVILPGETEPVKSQSAPDPKDSLEEKTFIKWVDFKVTSEALNKAYTYDKETYGKEVHLNWIELLAYLAVKNGGDFSKYKNSQLESLAKKLIDKEETMESLTKDLKYYDYYLESYTAILSGFVGEYQVEIPVPDNENETQLVDTYGLKGFLPIAKGFPYNDYDDFGTSRSYGYKRKHLGHDMMGQVGTPIVAVESGYVEALGWNQYGGWRLGIRSFDGRRYYYYAHLRKNFPYCKQLSIGSVVTAGDVIGYLGRTGYSAEENTNNIDIPHLHFGIQLIFDDSQKEGNGEIWIDCYQILKFLYTNRSQTVKNEETKDYFRIYEMVDPEVDRYIESHPITEENNSSLSAKEPGGLAAEQTEIRETSPTIE